MTLKHPVQHCRHLARRHFLGATLSAACVPTAYAATPGALHFEILRKGSVIGSHAIAFDRRGGTMHADIDVEMRVKFGFITLFRYHHQAVETWQDGQFVSLESQTDNNGDALALSARRSADGVHISNHHGITCLAPADALPLTHWNVACMRAHLFNPQDGVLMKTIAQREGADTVALADGSRVAATRYSLAGALPLEDWYDDSRIWAALRAQVKDGSVLEYRRSV